MPALLALPAIVAGCTVVIAPERGQLGLAIDLAVFATLNGLAPLADGVRARSARDR